MNIPFDTVEGFLNYVFANATEGDAESVVRAVDKHAESVWAMHVGAQKGSAMDAVIAKHKPKILVELGGYFGYSAIRFAFQARKYDPEAHYFSVEYNSVLACVIESMARFAGLGDAITVLRGDLTGTIGQLKKQIKDKFGRESIGFLLLDPMKVAYVPDVELAYKEGLLQKGSVIVADNVLRPGAPAYKKYMEVETKIYSSEYQEVDGDAIITSVVN